MENTLPSVIVWYFTGTKYYPYRMNNIYKFRKCEIIVVVVVHNDIFLNVFPDINPDYLCLAHLFFPITRQIWYA